MHPDSDPRVRRLLEARPFRDRVCIAQIEPLAGDDAHSGTAFLATDDDGRRYKLRDCGRPARAASVARWVQRLPDVFPRLEARDGRYLLLEALEDHRPLERRELIRAADRLGRIGALAHRAGHPRTRFDRGWRRALGQACAVRFGRELALLARREVVPRASIEGARAKFRAHRRRFGLPVALELDDLHKGNWMLRESDGDLRYVDEEGIALRPKGTGLASLLKTATRTNTWHLYKRGYVAEAQAEGPALGVDWLDWDYTEYLLLLDTVRRVAHKVRTEARAEKLPDEVEQLRALADTPERSLDWRFPKGDG